MRARNVHRPELVRRAGFKALRAHVWSRRLATRAMPPLERACAELAVTILRQDAHELMRLAHVPRPEVRHESPAEFFGRLVREGRMVVGALPAYATHGSAA